MEVIGALKMSETELNLGLGLGLGLGPPRGEEGVAVAAVVVKSGSKRGFSETMDLKLNLVSSNNNDNGNDNDNDSNDDECGKNSGVTVVKEKSDSTSSALDLMKKVNNNDKEISSKVTSVVALDHSAKPPAKAQVVGWPPVRSYRKNMLAVKKAESEAEKPPMTGGGGGGGGGLVKVSMDGAPYLRKVDLKMYNSYQHLSDALSNMFSYFTIGNYGAQGMIDFMNESKVMDLINGFDYVPTYEDKDGDWMLVGDVPWGMFVESCKRLRIMKGKEAAGLAPRAMEKCKNRS